MLTSAYNNGVSENTSYNNDNTLASINFHRRPIGISATIGREQKQKKRSAGITARNERFTVSMSARALRRRDRPCRGTRRQKQLDQAWNLKPRGDGTVVTRTPAPQSRTPRPTHELLTAAGQAITHDAKGQTKNDPPAMLRPGSTRARD